MLLVVLTTFSRWTTSVEIMSLSWSVIRSQERALRAASVSPLLISHCGDSGRMNRPPMRRMIPGIN